VFGDDGRKRRRFITRQTGMVGELSLAHQPRRPTIRSLIVSPIRA
jgi:hypothetical protein